MKSDRREKLVLPAAVVLISGIYSCSAPEIEPEISLEEQPPPVEPPTLPEAPTDQGITSILNQKFRSDRFFSPGAIQVRTQEGIVTLSGTVKTLQERIRAIETVKPLLGVRSIIDQLRMRPADRSDQQILSDVLRNLQLEPSIDPKEFAIRVSSGIVFLQGSVDSEVQKEMAQAAARNAPGVEGVIDQVEVVYGLTRPDAEIQRDIEARLRADPWAPENQLSVQVLEGRVTLSGTVGGREAKDRAEAATQVIGVRSLDSRQVRIVTQPLYRLLIANPFPLESDIVVKKAISDAIRQDSRLARASIQVSVDSGLVRLTGQAPSAAAKRAAENDAIHTPGTLEVINQVEVRAS